MSVSQPAPTPQEVVTPHWLIHLLCLLAQLRDLVNPHLANVCAHTPRDVRTRTAANSYLRWEPPSVRRPVGPEPARSAGSGGGRSSYKPHMPRMCVVVPLEAQAGHGRYSGTGRVVGNPHLLCGNAVIGALVSRLCSKTSREGAVAPETRTYTAWRRQERESAALQVRFVGRNRENHVEMPVNVIHLFPTNSPLSLIQHTRGDARGGTNTR